MELEFIPGQSNATTTWLISATNFPSRVAAREMLANLHAESEIFFQVRKNRYNALNRLSLKASNGALKEEREMFI